MTMNTVMLIQLLQVPFVLAQVIVHRAIIKHGRMTQETKEDWTFVRACYITVCCIVAFFFDEELSVAAAIFSGGAAAFVFAMLFPLLLNLSLGWHPFYLGSTSHWDVAMISKHTGYSEETVRSDHQRLYKNDPFYRKDVHFCGATVCACMLLCMVVCATIAIHI